MMDTAASLSGFCQIPAQLRSLTSGVFVFLFSLFCCFLGDVESQAIRHPSRTPPSPVLPRPNSLSFYRTLLLLPHGKNTVQPLGI